MNRIFNSVVLIILASSLALVSCTQEVKTSDFENLKAEVEALNNQLKATDINFKTQITTLRFIFESYKNEVTPQLVALNEQMKADYEVLSAADVLLAQQLEEAQAALQPFISKNAEDIAVNKKAIEAAVAGYKKLVADAIKDYEAAIAKAQEDQASVDGAQDAALVTLASQIATYKEAIDEAVAALSGSVEELASMMEETQGSVEDLAAAMKELEEKVDANLAAAIAYTDALEATVKATTDALAERIEANEAAIKKLNEETIPEIGDAIDALEASMVGLEGILEALEEKKLDQDVFQAFLTTFIEWMGKVETDIASFNGSLEQLQQFETVLDNEIKEISALVDVLNGDESVKGSVKQQIKALHEDIIEHLNELKEELKGEIDSLEADLEAVKGNVENIQTEITVIKGLIQANATEIGKLDVRITNNEGNIADLQKAKTELENKITALEQLLAQKEEEIKALLPAIEEKIALINGDKDTPGSIAYAVDQLDQAIQTQMGLISGRIDKTDAEIAELQKEIGKLQQYIQSLVFVPQYQDLKFGIPFTKLDSDYKEYNASSGFAVVYKVAPAYLAQPLAKAVNDAIAAGVALPFTFDIDSNLQTRAADTDPQLFIKDATGDDKTGKMTFFLSHKNFDPEGGNLDKYAISLRVDNTDYNVHVASEYVQTKLHLISSLTVIKDHLYKPNATTGEADSAISIDGDDLTDEKQIDIEYTDGEVYTSPFEGYELAAKDEQGVIRTYSQWKALDFDMPDVTVTATKISGNTGNINASLNGTSSTFAVKIKNGNNDNMKSTKKDIGKGNRYNFAFSDGKNTVNAQYGVSIAKHNGAFHFKFPYKMVWTYTLDVEVDHTNRGKDPSDWTKGYQRDGTPHEANNYFLVNPYIIVGDQQIQLNGSNKVFGLEADDFFQRSFSTTEQLPSGADFYVVGSFYRTNRISLLKFMVNKEHMGKTYEYTGTYNLDNKFTTEPDVTEVIIKTIDRKWEDIEVTAPTYELKLLSDKYDKDDDCYKFESINLANLLTDAYIAQGIFPPNTTAQKAFEFKRGEFRDEGNYPRLISAEGLAANFDYYALSSDDLTLPVFQVKTKGDKLTSDILHKVASNYENKPWSMTFETYVGQRFKITMPIHVTPLYDYRFVTNGLDTSDNSFQVPVVWASSTDNITKAKTELELIKEDDAHIQVMYSDGTSGYTVKPYGEFNQGTFKLIPRFSLESATEGVAIDSSVTAGSLRSRSLVKYYSQTPSVGIKSSLYVKSGDTEFLVPGSDQMFVGETPVTSVNVKPSNPIAAGQAVPVPPTDLDASGEGLVELTMQDVLGNKLYDLGHIQDNAGSYKETVKKIFGSVKFSVYTVNGSPVVAGWSIKGANSFGVSDTPDDVKLITNGVAAGTYTVVIKANTVWKDNYFYTVKVNVQ